MKLKVKIPTESKVTVYGYTLNHKGRATRALATEIGNMILSYVKPKPLSKNWTGKLETVTLYIVPEDKCIIETIDRPEKVILPKDELSMPERETKPLKAQIVSETTTGSKYPIW